MRKSLAPILVATLASGLLTVGLARLFAHRFAAGDIYPPYSTLRTDPLGSRVFYEALERLPDVAVERSFLPLDRIEADPSATLFILGWTPPRIVSGATNMPERIAALARDGTRVVIALTGAAFAKTAGTETCGECGPGADTPDRDRESGADDVTPCQTNRATGALWLGEVRFRPATGSPAHETTAIRHESADAALPAEIAWRNSWTFEPLCEEWSVVYEQDGRPTVVERFCGRGSIVLCATSFPIGNEALWQSRATPFLAWLAGDANRALFLESHHGLTEHAGVMTLIRRFRLQGALAGLALLTALFVWQQGTPLVPPLPVPRNSEQETDMTGRDMHSGFVSLLKRAVPAPELAATCVETWAADQRRPATAGADPETRLRRLCQDGEKRMRDPVTLYRALCASVKNERKDGNHERTS